MPVVQINTCMHIYKIINNTNGKWYIGKHNGKDPNYFGSGKLLRQAVEKYGQANFTRIILEEVDSQDDLNTREQEWIAKTNAVEDPMSYNLASGGEGGDLSAYIPYNKIDYSNHKMEGTAKWFRSLSEKEKKEWHMKQAEKRCKGWYVSKVDDPTETYVQNISKWCEEHSIDKSMPTRLNNSKDHCFQKQTKGWRIRRSDMPKLPPYENLRGKIIRDNGCKGKTWKIIDGKRTWIG